MSAYHAETEEYDEDSPKTRGRSKGFWSNFMHTWTNGTEEDEYEEEVETAEPPVASISSPPRTSGGSNTPVRRSPGQTLRLETARRSRVTVRRMVMEFEDVQRAVDGMREGIQQIVNLESTPPEMAERLVDFMNGATYAIDGAVEKIGEKVYLFTPQTVTVEVEDRPATSRRPSFLDR